ncbi:TetR-like C-terminal domain-containing protein [Ruegeria faecimaris]|uniref:Transcriptional regulator, TetR family n=1 Tax=Ruegeria faecimaris TaxID=686389 RepID=A0A521CLG2_9RHOB|nr:TetR-like C-terminal domain-containing protein [Ruegeria faecimaris]SMO59530.1 transcriptional regulator, TetR family [Ruegeria faecimaris]
MKEDPRLIATRQTALDAAQKILMDEGVLHVTHGSVSKATGISRSTLYRHWPDARSLRDAAFRRIATPPNIPPKTDGPLRSDLRWLLGVLMGALNDTPWGQIAPQVVAAASNDAEARLVITEFMKDRFASVEAVFAAAIGRGEITADVPVDQLIELAVAAPYFRKLIRHEALDEDWLDQHVDLLCSIAKTNSGH